MVVKKTVGSLKKAASRKPVGKKVAKAAVKKPAAKGTAAKTAKPARAAKPKAAKVVKKTVKAAKPKKAEAHGMPEQLRDTVLRVLDDRQAEQIVTFDLRGRSSMADYLIIASGRAARQIAAIADMVRTEAAKLGIKQVRIEGTGEGNWVLVDVGDVIVHLFRPEVRRFYNIETIYDEG